jgi:hypothetical protein
MGILERFGALGRFSHLDRMAAASARPRSILLTKRPASFGRVLRELSSSATTTHKPMLQPFGSLWKGLESAPCDMTVDLVNFRDQVKNDQGGIRRGDAIGLMGLTEGRGSAARLMLLFECL